MNNKEIINELKEMVLNYERNKKRINRKLFHLKMV